MNTAIRRTWIAPAIVTGIAAAVIPTAWASADASHQPAHATGTTVMTVHWRAAILHSVDTRPKGLSSGDTLQARFTLTGKMKGSADFACTAVAAHYLCQGIIRLPHGDLYAATGPVNDNEPAAIEGGTRAYAGVRGQFTQIEKPNGAGSWTITLRR